MDKDREITTPMQALDTQQVVAALLSATVGGGLVTGAVCAFAGGIGFPIPLGAVPAIALPITAGWFYWQLKPNNRAVWKVETWLGQDLDNDTHIGEPSVQLNVHTDQGMKRVDFDATQDLEHLRTFAVTALADEGFNERAMCKMMAWKRDDWVAARDRMLDRGFAEWKGKPGSTQGVRLTPEGEVAMQQAVKDIEGRA